MTCVSSPALLTRSSLSPEQLGAVQFALDRPSSGLFLPLGFGKTVVTLTAIQQLIDQFDVGRVLIVGPKKVIETVWHKESAKWAHTAFLKVGVCVGSQKHRQAIVEAKNHVVAINVENLQWLIAEYGLDDFQLIVLDEASMFKDPSTKRFKGLRKALTDQRVIALTGTPTGNKVENLWPIMYLLDKGERLLRTITAFRQVYMVPNQTNGHIVYNYRLKPGAFDQITEKISDICLSGVARDEIAVHHRNVKVQLPEVAYERMRAMARDFVSEGLTAATAAVASNKLLQMAGGACLDEDGRVETIHTAKIDALHGMLDDLIEPVVVVYWYRHEKERLLAEFPDAIDLDKPEHEQMWNEGKIPILLLHPQKGAHGLNLQFGGSQMIWFSMIWSLELYLQTCARLPRTGQKRDVYIHHLIADGTIDEEVLDALRRHEQTQQRVIDAVKRSV